MEVIYWVASQTGRKGTDILIKKIAFMNILCS
jgi:hypothetical protein